MVSRVTGQGLGVG